MEDLITPIQWHSLYMIALYMHPLYLFVLIHPKLTYSAPCEVHTPSYRYWFFVTPFPFLCLVLTYLWIFNALATAALRDIFIWDFFIWQQFEDLESPYFSPPLYLPPLSPDYFFPCYILFSTPKLPDIINIGMAGVSPIIISHYGTFNLFYLFPVLIPNVVYLHSPLVPTPNPDIYHICQSDLGKQTLLPRWYMMHLITPTMQVL